MMYNVKGFGLGAAPAAIIQEVVSTQEALAMAATELKRRQERAKRSKPSRPADRGSFRDLKAFGLWADRDDVKDSVAFVKLLRSRMEHGNDSK
jgi:hypothetical protein